MDEPRVRATTAEDEKHDDPSEDHLFLLVEDLEDGDHLVVEDLRDASGHTYVQVLRIEDTWLVEQRSGTPESHEHAVADTLADAHHEVVTAAFRLDRPRRLRWSPGFGG